MTPFRRLLDLFHARFFENDTVSPDGGFETNIYQLLGFLAAPGFLISYLLMPQFLELATKQLDSASQWALRIFRLFFPAFSFAVVGFATFFEWDKLFPDRRDFLILGSFPIPLRTLLAAKIWALCLFLLALVAAINFFPTLMGPLLSLAIPQVRKIGFLRVVGSRCLCHRGRIALCLLRSGRVSGAVDQRDEPRRLPAHLALDSGGRYEPDDSGAAAVSGLFVAAANRGDDTCTMAVVFPASLVHGSVRPPAARGNPLFASLGRFGGQALAIAVAMFCITWAAGFRRHYRRTLEAEDTDLRRPRPSVFGWLPGSNEEHAIFRFTGRILARSSTHRLFLASYWSVGIAIGLLTTIVVRNGRLGVSPDGLRGFPLLVVFFVISGFRAAFQFPAELASNWLFRMTEEHWTEVSRRATRKRVLASGLLPAFLLILPLEMARWGVLPGVFHSAFQLSAGALLVEVLFWSFNKVPFTCSYFPGKVSLALLAGLYLYGFTTYSFRMADLETTLETRPAWALLFFGVALCALALSWRRHPSGATVRFDGNNPDIQTLDLS